MTENEQKKVAGKLIVKVNDISHLQRLTTLILRQVL